MRVTVVTSCSAEGWEKYGRRFAQTFARHWPADIPLFVASEDPLGPEVYELLRGRGGAMAALSFLDLSLPWGAAHAFAQRHRDNRVAHGRERRAGQAGWTVKKVAEGYNFRYDAFRFAKKVFAILAGQANAAGGWLLWIDADVVTFADVTPDFLAQVLPARAFALSCLDRGPYHSECGFVGYNLDCPPVRGFIRSFAGLYESDQVFREAEWHDSYVFDQLRRRWELPAFAIPHLSHRAPFPNSILGSCMDHLKGGRKALGRTPDHEMVAGHQHPYWTRAA